MSGLLGLPILTHWHSDSDSDLQLEVGPLCLTGAGAAGGRGGRGGCTVTVTALTQLPGRAAGSVTGHRGLQIYFCRPSVATKLVVDTSGFVF